MKPADSQKDEAELKKSLEGFHKAFGAGSDDEKRKALAALLIDWPQLDLLFSRDADRIWSVYGRVRKRYLEHVDEFEYPVPAGVPVEIELIDVRQKDPSNGYRQVLAVIPKDIPVYRALFKHERGSSGSGTYLKVKGRWCWFQGLESIPALLDGRLDLGRVK